MTFIGNYYNDELVYKFINQARFWYRPKIFSIFAIYISYATCNWLGLLTDWSTCQLKYFILAIIGLAICQTDIL